MAKLWFSVGEHDDSIVVRIHVPGPPGNRPAVLEKILDLLGSGQRDSLRSLTLEFPGDSKTIEALDNFLRRYRIRKTHGYGWNIINGHMVLIETYNE